MKRQKDIEIYIKNCPDEALFAWLESIAGNIKIASDEGDEPTFYDCAFGRFVITKNTLEDESFTSITFCSPERPWATDVECGRDAANALGYLVRCDPGEHYPEVDPHSETLLEIDGKTEKLVDIIED